MDYKTLAWQLAQRCLDRGADAAEVYLEIGRRLNLEVRKGEIETVKEASSYGAGLRVFIKGRMAFASTNDVSERALDDAMARAITFARVTTADRDNVLPDDKGETRVSGLYDPEIAKVPMAQKIELARTAEQLAMRDPRITKSEGATYSEEENEVILANTHGLQKSFKSGGCGFSVSVVAEKGEQRSSGSEACERRFYKDLKPAAEIAAKAARDAYEMLDPHPVKTQRAAVIFTPDVAYALLVGVLAAANGERVLQGASFLGQRLGQKIASELITLVDDGTRPKGIGSEPFDGEGVPTQKRNLIENGVLRGFMYNTIVGRRAGVRSTGNASRRGFESLPVIGPHNADIEPGKVKPEDIIRDTQTGFLVKEITGYGINPVNGHFSGGASGFWVEGGKIAFPVRGLTIAGTADEILNGINMVADDADLARRLTAPTLRIGVLQIGGE